MADFNSDLTIKNPASVVFIPKQSGLRVGIAVMVKDGGFYPWDTSDVANKERLLGYIIASYPEVYSVLIKGAFIRRNAAAGDWFVNSLGELVNSLPGGSFAHKFGEQSGIYFKINETVVSSEGNINSASTGVSFGGRPTVDGGVGVGTTVSVTAGEGSILDITDAENPTYTIVTWPAQSAIALDTTSPNITYWYFDDNSGVIKQTTTRPTFPERKGAIFLFRTIYNAGAITALGSEITQLQHTATAISAISEVLGPVNLFGNEPTNSGANLKLKITSGKVYDYGANYFNSYIDPHAVSFATFDTGVSDTFRYAIQSGVIAVDETDIDVANYNNSGVVTAIPGSSMRVGIHYVFRFSDTGNVRLAYGSDWYQNEDDALAAISGLDPRGTVTAGFSNAQLLGAIIVRKNETDLSNATFVTANKFGELSGGSISTGGGSYLEIANNLSDLASASTARTNLDVYSTSEVDALLVPIGTVEAYRFNDIPTGYLLLDGSTYNVDDYPVLGAKYGGSPGGTFDVDDWSDVPLWGTGVNSAGDVVGSDTVDLSHSHTTSGTTSTDGAHNHGGNTGNDSSGSSKFILSILGSAASDSPHTHSISSDGDHSHTTSGTTDSQLGSTDKKPRRAHVNWIIKAL